VSHAACDTTTSSNLKMEAVFSSETLSKLIPDNRVSHRQRLQCTQSFLWRPPGFTRTSSSKKFM